MTKIVPYGTETSYRAGEAIPFADFKIMPRGQSSQKFIFAGIERSRGTESFVVLLPDGSTLLRALTNGFPGGAENSFGFAVNRRLFFEVRVWNGKISAKQILSIPSEENGKYQLRTMAELGQTYDLEGEILAFPLFDLKIAKIEQTKERRHLSAEDIREWYDSARKQYEAMPGLTSELRKEMINGLDSNKTFMERNPEIVTLRNTFYLAMSPGVEPPVIKVDPNVPSATEVQCGPKTFVVRTAPPLDGALGNKLRLTVDPH